MARYQNDKDEQYFQEYSASVKMFQNVPGLL